MKRVTINTGSKLFSSRFLPNYRFVARRRTKYGHQETEYLCYFISPTPSFHPNPATDRQEYPRQPHPTPPDTTAFPTTDFYNNINIMIVVCVPPPSRKPARVRSLHGASSTTSSKRQFHPLSPSRDQCRSTHACAQETAASLFVSSRPGTMAECLAGSSQSLSALNSRCSLRRWTLDNANIPRCTRLSSPQMSTAASAFYDVCYASTETDRLSLLRFPLGP